MSSLITLDQLQTSLEEIKPSITALEEIFGAGYTGFTRKSDTTVGNYSFAYGYPGSLEASGDYSHAEGYGVVVSGARSHGEGWNTTASGGISHAEGVHTTASNMYDHAEGNYTTASGGSSHAEGVYTTASGGGSHAEGGHTTASGNYSHAEGCSKAYGIYSHAEGYTCTGDASLDNSNYGSYAHAEGYNTVACANSLGTADDGTYVDCSHAEGYGTKSSAVCAHAEGSNTTASGKHAHAEGYGPTASGSGSHAEGYASGTITASGTGSHAEGYGTVTASGTGSHAEGYGTVTASGNGSHAEGYGAVTTSGNGSHAEGYGTTASGVGSHAEGYYTATSVYYSHAGGYYTEAYTIAQTVIGQRNSVGTTTGSATTTTGNAFVIGNGTSSSALSNAFRVTKAGATYGLSAFNSSGADYAEFVKEWADGNEDNEDRVGYFVTIRDGLLYKANEGDYIVGITSGNPSIIGNGDENYYWRFERDELNRFIMEDVEEEVEQTDEDGNPVIDEETGEPVMVKTGNIIENGRFKWNENYDASQEYIERKDRPEWDYVGMMGVIPVRDDGTCEAGSYCKCGVDGVATAADTWTMGTYFVIERISDNIVSVIMK